MTDHRREHRYTGPHFQGETVHHDPVAGFAFDDQLVIAAHRRPSTWDEWKISVTPSTMHDWTLRHGDTLTVVVGDTEFYVEVRRPLSPNPPTKETP